MFMIVHFLYNIHIQLYIGLDLTVKNNSIAKDEYTSILCSMFEYSSILCSMHKHPSMLCSMHKYPSILCSMQEYPSILYSMQECPSILWRLFYVLLSQHPLHENPSQISVTLQRFDNSLLYFADSCYQIRNLFLHRAVPHFSISDEWQVHKLGSCHESTIFLVFIQVDMT